MYILFLYFTVSPFGAQGIVMPCIVCPSVHLSYPSYHSTAHNIEQILFIYNTAIDLSRDMNPIDYGVSRFIF